MKIKPGFETHNVCGEIMVMALGEENIDFSHVITLNETSYFIWQKLESGVDTVEELVKCITDEYDIDATTAERDLLHLLAKLQEYGVLE